MPGSASYMGGTAAVAGRHGRHPAQQAVLQSGRLLQADIAGNEVKLTKPYAVCMMVTHCLLASSARSRMPGED